MKKALNNGLLNMLAACAAFSVMGLSLKLLTPYFPPTHLLFLRGATSALLLLPFILRLPLPTKLSTWGLLLVRSITGVLGMGCYIYALGHIPLSTANVLFHASPIFTAIYAYLLLGERSSRRLSVILLLGFIGMAMVLRPSLDVAFWPSLMAIVAALFSSLAYVTVRRLRLQNTPALWLVTAFLLGSALISAPLYFINPIYPTGSKQWLLIFTMGISGALGQLLMTRSFRLDTAARITTVGYSSILFAFGWDVVLFHHHPDLMTVAGSALIILGGVLLQTWDKSPRS